MRYSLFIILLASCTTQSKVTQWLDAHPMEAATYCADKFPPIITHDTSYVHDTTINTNLVAYIDSMFIETHDTLYKVIKAKIKPCISTTTAITTTIVDSARIVAINGKLEIVQRELKGVTESRNRWRRWFLILALCTAIYFIIKRLI